MPDSSEFHLLHLSDAHIGNPDLVDQDMVLNSLVKDIKETFSSEVPNLIVFSGDLVWGEDPKAPPFTEQLAKARIWIEAIHNIWSRKIGDIPLMIVPGNHDVARSKVDPTHTQWLKSCKLDEVDQMIIAKTVTWRGIQNRLSEWWEFIRNLTHGHWTFCDDLMITHGQLRFGDKTIAVIGYNTSWASHSSRTDQSQLRLSKHQAHLGLQATVDSTIGIAVHHHPLSSWLHPDEAVDLERKVQSHFKIALHGHIHSGWYTHHSDGHLSLSGGACWAGSGRENGYSWLTLNSELNSVLLHGRQYDDKFGLSWKPVSLPTKFDVEGKVRLSLDLHAATSLEASCAATNVDAQETELPVASVTEIAATFPLETDTSPWIPRDDQLRTLTDLLEAKKIVLLTGAEGSGKTVLAAQLARQQPSSCICVFLDHSRYWSSQLSHLYKDVYNQAHWLLHSKESTLENPPSQAQLQKLSDLLTRKARGERKPFFIVIDGLNNFPTSRTEQIEDVFKLLDFFGPAFRKLISIEPEQLPSQIREGFSWNTFPTPFFTEAETKLFLNDIASPNLIEEVAKITRRKPATLAAIRRILKVQPNIHPDDFSDRIEDLLKLEWKQVPETDEQALMVLACVANFPSRFTVPRLAELLKIESARIEGIVSSLPLLVKKPGSGELCFESKSMARFAHAKLKGFERPIRERLLDSLMARPESYESLDEIPVLLNELGRNEELLAFVSPDHLTRLLQKGQSWHLAIAKVDLAFAAAQKTDNLSDYSRLALHKSCLFQFMDAEATVLTAEAMMVMGLVEEAMFFANSQVTKENRLMTLAVIAKHAKELKLVPPPGLSEEIHHLATNLPPEATADQRLDLATELIHTHPELAIRIVEAAPGSSEDINSALLKVSFHALARLSTNSAAFDNSSKPISSIIQNDKISRFTTAAQALFGKLSARDALQKIKGITEATDQIYFLRQWASANASADDGYPLVEYALDLVVRTTGFVPNAKVLQQLASPLPYLYRDYSVVVLATRFSQQAQLIKGKGFTQDYVALELLLIRTAHRYEEPEFRLRLEQLIQYVEEIADNPTKFHCLALISRCLSTHLTASLDPIFASMSELVDLLVDNSFDQLIQFTANNYNASASGLYIIHSYDPARATKLALRLNTETRRNRMLADLIYAEFDKSSPNAVILTSIAQQITDYRHVEITLCGALDSYQPSSAATPELVEWAFQRIKEMATPSIKFDSFSSLLSIIGTSAEPRITLVRDAISELLQRCWTDIDDPAIRWSAGLRLVKTVASHNKALASEFWGKLQQMGANERLPNEGCTLAIQDNIRLEIRLFKGLLKKELVTEADRRLVVRHIESLPSSEMRAFLFAELALIYFRQKKATEGKEIAQTYLWPTLSALAQKGRPLYETIFSEVAPALFLANAENTKESIRTFSPMSRDATLSRICDFLKRRKMPGDPYKAQSRDPLPIPGGELFDLVSLLELAEDDALICWNAVQVIKTAIKDQRLSREQKRDLHSRLERLASTKFPSPRFIQHSGYQLVVQAELAGFYGAPSESEIDRLVGSARKIENIADQAFVLACIATTFKGRQREKACRLVTEAIDLIPKICAIEDQLERCATVGNLAAEVDQTIAKKALETAVGIVKGTPNTPSQHQIDRVIDAANLIDSSLAEHLSKELDNDPARLSSAKGKLHKELKKAIRKMLVDGSLPDLLEEKKHDALLEVVDDLWGESNAGKRAWLKLPTCRNLIKIASSMMLEKSAPLWMFIVENLVAVYEDTPAASGFIRPLFESVCINTEFISMLGRTTMANSLQDWNQSLEEFQSGRIRISSGERLRALDEIERWLLENVDDLIYVVDPSFNLDAVALLQAIRRSAPDASIIVVSTKEAQRQPPKGLSIEEHYREECAAYPELGATGTIDVKLIASGSYGDVDFKERAVVTRSGALLMSSPFTDYGTQNTAFMARAGSSEAQNILDAIDQYLDSRKRKQLPRPITISGFTV